MRQFVPLLRDVKNTGQISGDSWMTSDNNSCGILPANTKSEPFMTIHWVFPSKPYLILFRNNGKWSRSPHVMAQICTGPSARSRNADEKIRAKIFSWQRLTRRVVALYSWENTRPVVKYTQFCQKGTTKKIQIKSIIGRISLILVSLESSIRGLSTWHICHPGNPDRFLVTANQTRPTAPGRIRAQWYFREVLDLGAYGRSGSQRVNPCTPKFKKYILPNIQGEVVRNGSKIILHLSKLQYEKPNFSYCVML